VPVLPAVGRLSPVPGTDEIARAARGRVGYITLQAVYEALNALTSAGLLRRIGPAGSPARHESRIGDNHEHIVCRRCGTITDVDRAAAPAPCPEPLASAGFAIERAEVTFWGLCPPYRALKGQPRESMAQGPRP